MFSFRFIIFIHLILYIPFAHALEEPKKVGLDIGFTYNRYKDAQTGISISLDVLWVHWDIGGSQITESFLSSEARYSDPADRVPIFDDFSGIDRITWGEPFRHFFVTHVGANLYLAEFLVLTPKLGYASETPMRYVYDDDAYTKERTRHSLSVDLDLKLLIWNHISLRLSTGYITPIGFGVGVAF